MRSPRVAGAVQRVVRASLGLAITVLLIAGCATTDVNPRPEAGDSNAALGAPATSPGGSPGASVAPSPPGSPATSAPPDPPAPSSPPGSSATTEEPALTDAVRQARARQALADAMAACGGEEALRAVYDCGARIKITAFDQREAGMHELTVYDRLALPRHYIYNVTGLGSSLAQGQFGDAAWGFANNQALAFPAGDPKFAKDRREVLIRKFFRELVFLYPLLADGPEIGPLEWSRTERVLFDPLGDPEEATVARKTMFGVTNEFFFRTSDHMLLRARLFDFPAFDGGLTSVQVTFRDFRDFVPEHGARGGPAATSKGRAVKLPAGYDGVYLARRPDGAVTTQGQAFSASVETLRLNYNLSDDDFIPPPDIRAAVVTNANRLPRGD
ncbi:MAG: hypothetical protein HY719_01305 [Planctomycetes bacterium]|nr:hypothetical protein [Planctomycetota bacterium]